MKKREQCTRHNSPNLSKLAALAFSSQISTFLQLVAVGAHYSCCPPTLVILILSALQVIHVNPIFKWLDKLLGK